MDDVSEQSYDNSENVDAVAPDAGSESAPAQSSEADQQLVQKLLRTIKADKRHFKRDFDRMKRDMFMARDGRDPDYPEKYYKANIVGRHVNQKTASIYAKNPKVAARRKEMLDFQVWDENPESLQQAMMLNQAFMQATGGVPPVVADPITGAPVPAPLPPEVQQAQAILADVQQGLQRRQMLRKFGKTLEIVYADGMKQQTPLDFKTAMKGSVRQANTTAVAYVELGFQREYGVPNSINNQLDDCRDRLAHLEKLMQGAAEGEISDYDGEMAELQQMIANLENEEQVCIRRGLTFKGLESTAVIPDRYSRRLGGFLGGRHLTIAEIMPLEKVEETYKVDLGQGYTPYNDKGEREGEQRGVDYGDDYEATGIFAPDRTENDLVCVYKHYSKRTGLVYHMVDGHADFLQPPAPPEVTVPRFWPVYALSFNNIYSETELFPLSEVALLRDQQTEINRSRQGKREHRQFARPRLLYTNGTLDPDKDIPELESAPPFKAIGISGDVTQDVAKRLVPFPMPGVDPNLYDTGEVMMDGSLTVGASAAQLGGMSSKTTATGEAIADAATSTADSSSVDDLDSFLTAMARDGGIILMQELTKEDVVKIAGPGAVWVEDLGMSFEDIQNEIYLEVEAGSSGKPNQAQEVRNFKELGPIIMQIPGVSPTWFGREAIRRLDDRIDVSEAIIEGLPAMVALNRQQQPMQGGDDPSKQDPNQQGDKGGDKGPPPAGPVGTGPAMGANNQ